MVAWEEIPIEVLAFEIKWMLHLTSMVGVMTARTVGWDISYDCTRKLTENDKLKALKSKL